MQNQKGADALICSLIGMDLFSQDYPNLRSFKHFLLNGQSNNGNNVLNSEETNHAFLDLVNEYSIKKELNPSEQKLSLVLLRAFKDADQSTASTQTTILVHSPESIRGDQGKPVEISFSKIANAANLNIDLDQSVIKREDFSGALGHALQLMQKTRLDMVALCSFFAYTGANNTAQTNTGLGCVLLSKYAHSDMAYADLTWEESQQSADNISQLTINLTENNALAAPHSAPIIKMMQCALSLNNQTHFPEPDPHQNSEEQLLLHPWFPLPYADKREFLLTLPGRQSGSNCIRMEKSYNARLHPDQPFNNFGLFLLPFAFDDLDQGLQGINTRLNDLKNCQDLENVISNALTVFSKQPSAKYALTVLGTSKQDLASELERAREGLPKSFENGRDWQTPSGSYFTPKPLGAHEKIAFVYPGAFGTYVGMGRTIFYLFPQLYQALQIITEDPGKTINENVIFPSKITPALKEELQTELNNNPTEMISSGVCFSHLYTVILRDILKIQPQAVFGYSLGENSMMFATELWSQADGMRTSLEASPIFHDRVSGLQNAIREFWDLPQTSDNGRTASPIWANYVLMAPVDKVKETLKSEDRVYLTHINTPRQVVIGGEKEACQRVTQTLKCMHLQAPYHHAIHCKPIVSEFEAFARMHDWPVEYEPEIPVYSAADYAPLQYDSKIIADSFAKMLTNPIDFPRLVNLAYQDGARIFIELGAGSNCSKWVQAILKGKPHASMSINQNNGDDHTTILKLIARLASQRVPMDLSVLEGYSND